MRPSRNRQLSGRYWVTWIRRYAPNSDREDDLEMPFRNNAKAFIKALRDAGAHVKVDHTKRSRQTAYRKARPKDAKPYSGPLPVPDIEWDHGNLADSIKGAEEILKGFTLVHAPPPDSRHIPGHAIDMKITWAGTLKVNKKDGSEVSVPYMSDVNAKKLLHGVGASYGVHKLTNDKPHWSIDGH